MSTAELTEFIRKSLGDGLIDVTPDKSAKLTDK
jgi:hypothetical protein